MKPLGADLTFALKRSACRCRSQGQAPRSYSHRHRWKSTLLVKSGSLSDVATAGGCPAASVGAVPSSRPGTRQRISFKQSLPTAQLPSIHASVDYINVCCLPRSSATVNEAPPVAQTSKSAVSRATQPAERDHFRGLPAGKPAIQQVRRPALRRPQRPWLVPLSIPRSDPSGLTAKTAPGKIGVQTEAAPLRSCSRHQSTGSAGPCPLAARPPPATARVTDCPCIQCNTASQPRRQS
jgi:hypothetical protein